MEAHVPVSLRSWGPIVAACLLARGGILAQPSRHTPTAQKPPSAASLYQRLSPSVVTILVYDRDGTLLKSGSGVVLSPEGDIVTTYHVVEGGTFFEVRGSWSDDPADSVPARPTSCALSQDLAGLRIAAPRTPVPAKLGKKLPTVGERVFALGSPFALDGSLSEGIVSQLRQDNDRLLIQTTAAISPGSSGGGLFLENGDLVGITTLTLKGGQGLNFAVAIGGTARLSGCSSFAGDPSKPPARTPTKSPQPVLIQNGLITGNEFRTLSAHDRRWCAAGIIDGMLQAPLYGAPKERTKWMEDCLVGMNDEQVATILLQWLQRNPARWGQYMGTVAYAALKE